MRLSIVTRRFSSQFESSCFSSTKESIKFRIIGTLVDDEGRAAGAAVDDDEVELFDCTRVLRRLRDESPSWLSSGYEWNGGEKHCCSLDSSKKAVESQWTRFSDRIPLPSLLLAKPFFSRQSSVRMYFTVATSGSRHDVEEDSSEYFLFMDIVNDLEANDDENITCLLLRHSIKDESNAVCEAFRIGTFRVFSNLSRILFIGIEFSRSGMNGLPGRCRKTSIGSSARISLCVEKGERVFKNNNQRRRRRNEPIRSLFQLYI